MSNVQKRYYSQVSVEKSAERKANEESTLSLSFNEFTHFNFSHIFSRTAFCRFYLDSLSSFSNFMFYMKTNMLNVGVCLIQSLLMQNIWQKNYFLAFVHHNSVHKTQAHTSPLNNGPVLFLVIQGVIQSDSFTSHSSAGIHVVWIWGAYRLPTTIPVEHQTSASF